MPVTSAHELRPKMAIPCSFSASRKPPLRLILLKLFEIIEEQDGSEMLTTLSVSTASTSPSNAKSFTD